MYQDFDIAYYAYKRQGGGFLRYPEIQSWVCWYHTPKGTRMLHITDKSDMKAVLSTIEELLAEESEEWESGAIEMDDAIAREGDKIGGDTFRVAEAAMESADDRRLNAYDRIQARRKQEQEELDPPCMLVHFGENNDDTLDGARGQLHTQTAGIIYREE